MAVNLLAIKHHSLAHQLLARRNQQDQNMTFEQLAALPASLLALQQMDVIAKNYNQAHLQQQLLIGVRRAFSLSELDNFLLRFKNEVHSFCRVEKKVRSQ